MRSNDNWGALNESVRNMSREEAFNMEEFEKRILQIEDADTIGLSSEEREEVVEAMRSNDNWGFNNWRSCAGGHVYLVGRCGGPLEQRPCPAEGCNQMIGGAAELLNASNRPVRMFPAEVPQEVTDQTRFNVGLARHFGLTQEGVLAVVLLALQPSEVVQELSYRHNGRLQRARYSFWQIFPFQELLLLNSLPSTIHSEGWIVDWVDRARDFEIKDAADGLMVSLVGLTLSITGANIPGFTSKAPGGRPRSRSRSEDLQYLALIQVIAGVLEQTWKLKAEPRSDRWKLLPQMAAHIDKIISDF